MKLLELAAIVQKSVLDDRPWPMATPYIQSERDSIPLAVPGSRAAGGDGVVGSEPLTLAVPGSRAADGEGSRLQYLVPELQAVMGLWAVSPSHSQYLVPELRMARGPACSTWFQSCRR